jgi:hypothetical protein
MEKTEQPKVDRYGYKTEFINPEFRRKHNNKISK